MISLAGISKQYGQKVLLNTANLQINLGEKIGLVGPNGAGKTSLFRILMLEEGVEQGQVSIPDRCVIGHFSQDVGDMSGRSVLAEVLSAAGRLSKLAVDIATFEEQLANPELDEAEMTRVLERYGEAQNEFQSLGGYDLEARAKEILTGLGIAPDRHSHPVESFSGGWKMRIALARILALNPDVLLLDEPTNHLDLESILWLEEWIRSFKGAVLMTSHDREFMNKVVTRIVELSQRELISYSGDYEFYLKERQIRVDQIVAAHRKQQDMLAKEEEFIARFAARASHAAQVQSRVKKLEKIERVELPQAEQAMKIEFQNIPRSGNDVVAFENISKSWEPSSKPVFSEATGMIRRLDKIAVVGVNGAGKSTFLKTLIGLTQPSSGRVQMGSNVHLGYFSQHSLEVLNPQSTIYEQVAEAAPQASTTWLRGLLGAFLFSGDDVFKKINVLSGGEKSRVVLATLLARPLNFLVLDEPTNHLDIQSREVLLDALRRFEGTLMIVSHDRHFLKEISNRVIEINGAKVRVDLRSYAEYLEQKGAGR
jgi:ATP-binding cassette subfamily F protein 3